MARMSLNQRIKKNKEKLDKIHRINTRYPKKRGSILKAPHSILRVPTQDTLFSGVKPVKQKPTLDSFTFDKKQPISMFNCPTFSYADYWIYGYKTDAAGIKHPVQWKETLPCGTRVRFNKADYPGITITGCKRMLRGPIQTL